MNYKHIKKLNKTNILLGENRYILKSEDFIEIKSFNDDLLYKIKNEKFRGCDVYKNNFLIKKDFKGNKVFFQNHEHLIDTDKDGAKFLYDTILVNKTFNEDLTSSYLGYFDLSNNNYKWKKELNFIDLIVVNNKIILYKVDSIQIRDLEIGNLIWNYDLSELGELNGKSYEVRKFIGVRQDQLLIAFGNSAIIALDIQTGKLLKQWYQFDEVLKYNEYTLDHIPYAWSTMLDAEKDMLIGFNFFVCWQINLKTHQMKVIDMGNILKENNLFYIKNLTSFAMSKTHYYISAESPINEELNRKAENLIAINKDTLKIDWQYQFPDYMALGVNAPQYANNKLYQLDWDNTLHIFEKQENIA